MTLPVPSQSTFTIGEVLTAALMNSNVRDAVSFLASRPLAVLTQSVAQSLASGTATAITFDTEQIDTYAGHSLTTNNSRYTAQVAGWYLVMGTIWFNSNATGYRRADVNVNGSVPTPAQPSTVDAPASGLGTSVQVQALVRLSVGDYVELSGTQTSGGALGNNANDTSMSVLWVHT